MEPVVWLILLSVFIAATAQRVTGMGFALLAGPFLVLLLNPLAGVVLVNLAGMVSSSIGFSRTYKEVNWRLVWILALSAVCGTIPGAWLASTMPGEALQILIGVLIIVSLTVSLVLNRRLQPLSAGAGPGITAGLISGVMGSAAGVSGPAISTYAVLTRWDQRSFAATMQPFLTITSLSSVVTKLSFDHHAWPQLELLTWVLIVAAVLCGQVLGEWLAPRVAPGAARAAMISMAFLGGVATLAKGFGLLG